MDAGGGMRAIGDVDARCGRPSSVSCVETKMVFGPFISDTRDVIASEMSVGYIKNLFNLKHFVLKELGNLWIFLSMHRKAAKL